MDIELTKEQSDISKNISDWFEKGGYSPKYQVICGYAGTGKTVLLSQMSVNLKYKKNLRFAFCAYTGKASSVLYSKLNNKSFDEKSDFCGTIHQLMYRPEIEIDPITNSKKIIGWIKHNSLSYDLIMVDEASMLNQEIWNDLLEYNIPIIIVGDHGQLPPIGGNSIILNSNTFELKQIHRQALENPIIKLSIDVRNNGYIPSGIFSKQVFKLNWDNVNTQKLFNKIDVDKDTIVLCGFNKTRVVLNKLIRERNGFLKDYPYPNERIICLKNNRETKVMNGQLGSLRNIIPKTSDIYEMTIEMDDLNEYYSNLVHNYCFGRENYQDSHDQVVGKSIKIKYGRLMRESKTNTIDLFDFGYAISVHKSQGSEWDKVVLFEQKSKYWDDEYYSKWLYTAVTRAKTKLFIIYNYR